MNLQSLAFVIVAVVVVGILGAYVLLYPNTSQSYLALGTLTTIAGGVGTALFHSSTQGFLGTQLAAQRALTVAALTQPPSSSGTSSTDSINSKTPTASGPSPTSTTGSA